MRKFIKNESKVALHLRAAKTFNSLNYIIFHTIIVINARKGREIMQINKKNYNVVPHSRAANIK